MITLLAEPSPLSAARSHMPLRIQVDPNAANYDEYYVAITLRETPVAQTSLQPTGISTRFYPPPSGILDLSLHRILQAYLGTARPNFAIPGVQTYASQNRMMIKYDYQISDYGDGALLSTVNGTTRYAAQAGFGYQAEPSALDAWVTEGRFLTRQPRTKLVRPWQREYLTFVMLATSANHVLMLETTDASGTVSTSATGFAVSSSQVYLPVTIAVGHDALGLTPADEVVQYRVWFEASGSRASEIFTFRIDPVLSDQDRYYIFQNSLGGYDTLRTTGDLRQRENVGRIGGQTWAAGSYDRSRGRWRSADVRSYEEVEQQVGLQPTEAGQAWLRDLLRSPEVYRLGDHRPNLDGSGDLVPILLEAGTQEVFRDNEFLFGLGFAYRSAFENAGWA